ncbi:hypothetical protein GCM10007079_39830 [Nocardiopsis terrae]|nr:hypothetical protein GCM10007079_39830 [Nocardiopsis terrae]
MQGLVLVPDRLAGRQPAPLSAAFATGLRTLGHPVPLILSFRPCGPCTSPPARGRRRIPVILPGGEESQITPPWCATER